MDQKTEFISAIAAAPEDDVVRLAFSDWLEENWQLDRYGPW